MITSSTKELDISKKIWHRLIMVLFIIITLTGITIAIITLDWTSWVQTLSDILIGIVFWLIISNLVYYEGVVYIGTGRYGNSRYRKGGKKIRNTVLIAIFLVLLRFIAFPFVSNKVIDVAKNIGKNDQKIVEMGIDVDYTGEHKKIDVYCKMGVSLYKSAKSLNCIGSETKDMGEAQGFLLQALDLNPTIEEEIKIRYNLALSYFSSQVISNDSASNTSQTQNNVYKAKQQIDKLLSMSDLSQYPDIARDSYIMMGYITTKTNTLSDVLSMISEASKFATGDRGKYVIGTSKAEIYALKGNLTTALSVITSLEKDSLKIPNIAKQRIKAIENNIRKAGDL